jgi:tRNA A37 methylthiotransferase MiaB
VRRERTRILRDLADRKNRSFRERMLGRELQVVTLEQAGLGMTGNYLTVEMNDWRKPNELKYVTVAGLTDRGVREKLLLPVI